MMFNNDDVVLIVEIGGTSIIVCVVYIVYLCVYVYMCMYVCKYE